MSTGPADDVVVVGGGAIGLAIAWKAQAAGLRTSVVDDAPGRGASWAAAGMLAPVTEAHYGEEALLRLCLASAERYGGFARELEELAGTDVGYRRTGTLSVARDRDDQEALDELFDYRRGLGLECERLRGRECRRLEPALAPGIRGGVLVSGDHQVDNRALVTALLRACDRAGVRLLRERAVELLVERDRVTGVRLRRDTLACPTVVLAGGAWSAQLSGLPAASAPPVRPVKGQLLHLRGAA
ncbi:MAG: FAD-dependent oxidoreductase, partial [Actinomycetota bacterium]|nr:FAD-dependent oxidoreductase [Actinomycetota bacterium]